MPQVVLGKWFTRNSRVVMIDRSKEIEDAPSPGMPPTKRTAWEGVMFKADGKTEDTRATWENDGLYKTPLGVASQFDLVQLIEAAPEPEPTPETAAARDADHQAEYDDAIYLLASHVEDDETFVHALQKLIVAGETAPELCHMLVPYLDPQKDHEPADTLSRLLKELDELRAEKANQGVIVMPAGVVEQQSSPEKAAEELAKGPEPDGKAEA